MYEMLYDTIKTLYDKQKMVCYTFLRDKGEGIRGE